MNRNVASSEAGNRFRSPSAFVDAASLRIRREVVLKLSPETLE